MRFVSSQGRAAGDITVVRADPVGKGEEGKRINDPLRS
jgi:hypothetical protein